MSLALKMVLEKLKSSQVKCGLKKCETAITNVENNPIILMVFPGNRLSSTSTDSILQKLTPTLPYIFWETEVDLGIDLHSPSVHGLLCAAIVEDQSMDDSIKAALKNIVDMINMLLQYEQEMFTLVEQLLDIKVTNKTPNKIPQTPKEPKVKKVKEKEIKENLKVEKKDNLKDELKEDNLLDEMKENDLQNEDENDNESFVESES